MESITTELCEESGKRDRKGRRLLRRDEWYRLLAEYDRSGLTQEAFCKREGLRYGTFVAWVGRRKRDAAGVTPDGNKFLELSLPTSPSRGSQLEVILADGVVLRGDTAEALARLVRLLKD